MTPAVPRLDFSLPFLEGLLLRTHALSETGVYYEIFSLYQERLALRHNVAAPTACIAAGYSLPIRCLLYTSDAADE